MFGYVLPYIPNLRVFENEIYKATYCGLCKQLKKEFGFLCRLSLSYDMVFLTFFLIFYLDEKMQFERKVCKLHPFKKRLILKESTSLKKTANIGTILFNYKLKDNVKDSKHIKKILSFIFLILFKKSHKKAKKNEQEIEKIIFNFIKNQNQAEKKRKKSLDFYSHPTAKCLGEIFKTISKTEKDEESLYRTGYMLGKYIYLMDALDDLEKDKKNNNFNPFLEEDKTKKEIIKSFNDILNFSIAQLAESFEKIFANKNVNILRNVIYLGMKTQKQKLIKNFQNIKKK